MKKLLYKEFKLSASVLSYVFVAASFLTFVPGYPILLGAFFTTLGIFYSFQTMRGNSDIQYSLLLPVAKADIVGGKYLFVMIIEACSFVLMTAITLLRMLYLKNAGAYTENELMCANLTFLGFALLIFGLFNYVFVCGFFKTAYYFDKPFITYCVVSFIVIAAAETLHHIPGLESFNAFGFDRPVLQAVALFVGVLAFAAFTGLGYVRSVKRFENTDL